VVRERCGTPPAPWQRLGARWERPDRAVTTESWPWLRVLRPPPAGRPVRDSVAVAAGAAVSTSTHVPLRQQGAAARPPMCAVPAKAVVRPQRTVPPAHPDGEGADAELRPTTLCLCTSHDRLFL